MSGNERLTRNNVAFVALLSIIMNVIFVPKYGVMGAVMSTSVCLSLQHLVAAYLVNLKLGINTLSWINLFHK